MALFHIQDADRPGYVVADSLEEALSKWRTAVAEENADGEMVEPPDGVSHVCSASDLIVYYSWEG